MGKTVNFGTKRLGRIMFLFCISMMLFFTPSVNALSETYYADWNLPFDADSVGFSYQVEVDFQTEPNGKWILNKTYALTYTISITYVNQSYFDSDEVYMQFFEPDLSEQLWLRPVEVVKNSCIVDREQSGTVVARYTPDPAFARLDEERSTGYEAWLDFKVYKNQEALPYDNVVWQWKADYSLPITFEEEQASTEFDIFSLSIVFLGATVIVASSIGYLLYRRHKKLRESKK